MMTKPSERVLLNSTAIRLPSAQNRIEIRLPGAAAESRQRSDSKTISLVESGFLPGLKKIYRCRQRVTVADRPGLAMSCPMPVELSLGGKRYHISAIANYVRV
jgi:hypothetical protein